MADGMIVNYLTAYRLQWGEADTLSCLPTSLDASAFKGAEAQMHTVPNGIVDLHPMQVENSQLFGSALDAPSCFKVDTPSELISIIQNDWPYSG